MFSIKCVKKYLSEVRNYFLHSKTNNKLMLLTLSTQTIFKRFEKTNHNSVLGLLLRKSSDLGHSTVL